MVPLQGAGHIPTSPMPNRQVGLNASSYQEEGQRERSVTLKVYDILGNEIATLVNEEKQPGFYEVQFDGSRLSSGIYFYRIVIHSDKLQTDNFISTKKLILLK